MVALVYEEMVHVTHLQAFNAVTKTADELELVYLLLWAYADYKFSSSSVSVMKCCH
jgi:hypothetical protein